MNDPDDRELAEAWRRLIASHVRSAEDPSRQRSLVELRSSLLALEERVRPWILPPQGAPSPETAALLSQWTPAWTRELKSSRLWEAAESQLERIRQWIRGGNLEDADWEIRDLLIRCVPSARRLALEGFPARARAQDSHQGDTGTPEQPKTPEQTAVELNCLVDWLESHCHEV